MYVYLVFTQHTGDEFDQYQGTFMYQEDAMKYADELNMEHDKTYSYHVRVKVN